ncbi:hypothetical protein SUGI_0209200 [Cryptomeria japonica]|nr:hypothetical protein SUGI_0209200 [Cryptomeria japonica]
MNRLPYGYCQVIEDRKWKEITALFNFPPTATNTSFVLSEYYISLLHHYEQVYFFGAQGHQIPPPQSRWNSLYVFHVLLLRNASDKNIFTFSVVLFNPASFLGHPVTGVIYGKFEHGYLVTVVVGSEKLSGVLYQVPTEQFAEVPTYLNNGDAALGVRPCSPRRRKIEIKKKDPDHPKQNRNGYHFFFAEQYKQLKALHPGKDREITKMIGDSWKNLNEEEKSVR